MAVLIGCGGGGGIGPTGGGYRSGDTLAVDLPGGETMAFVWIEPGTFTMGSPESEPGREDDEGPQHEVTITQGFWLGKYEITQGEWLAVMETSPWQGREWVQEDPAHPAVWVTWDDVQAFVVRLDEAAGVDRYRLPTEAEWEYACRAGTTTRWSFGDEEDQLADYAWYFDNNFDAGLRYAQAVGTRRPNPWGLHDMHGSAFEWVQDRFEPYGSEAQVDPRGALEGQSRVRRGGYFADLARYTRCANRWYSSPDYRRFGISARLVRVE